MPCGTSSRTWWVSARWRCSCDWWLCSPGTMLNRSPWRRIAVSGPKPSRATPCALSRSFVGQIHGEHSGYDRAVAVTEATRRLAATTGNAAVVAGSQAEHGRAYAGLGAAARSLPLAPAAVVARRHLLAGATPQAARVLSPLPSFREAHRRAGYMGPMCLNVALAKGAVAWPRASSPARPRSWRTPPSGREASYATAGPTYATCAHKRLPGQSCQH